MKGSVAAGFVRVLGALALLGLVACQAGSPGGGELASITVTPETATIEVGQPQTFTAVGRDTSGNPSSVSLTWRSSNPEVATVTNGVATGVAEGTTSITAAASGVTSNAATLSVTPAGNGNEPPPLRNTIAYATGNGDEIRLINPDGGNDRRLWAHGHDDPSERYDVWSLSWSPDATQLAFASTHENWCSLFHADIFAVGTDGSDYRRVTQAPACAELADYPKGTVRVPVRNNSFDAFSGFLYFQGAPSLQPVNLPAFGTGTATFENVADFGDGQDWVQYAALITANDALNLPDARYILASTAIDVQDGGTVTTAEATLFIPDITWEARSPTWSADGSSLGFALNFNTLLKLPPEPGPLDFGSPLLAEQAALPNLILMVARGPTAGTANSVLHTGWSPGESMSIYLTQEGSTAVGEPLVSHESTEFVFGLAWLPDGSGFVYSVTEGSYFGEDRSSNLFIYNFASSAATRVTSFNGDFAGQMSVSPDGQSIVFEQASELDMVTNSLMEPDLWVINRDGSGLRLLVESAHAPAWSR